MVKINSLEIENTKRIKALALEPAENGLTVIGGKNGQGKTSVLDSIAWALGGDRYKPSSPKREGSVIPPRLCVTLSNGLVVERSGDSSRLKVTDTNGNRGGQQILNAFIEQLALDLPKFMQSGNKEKADTLLKIIGVGDKLYELENEEAQLYNQRHALGQIADQKLKYAKEMPFYPDAPKEPVSVTELIIKQQEILARNGENRKKREQRDYLKREYENAMRLLEEASRRAEELKQEYEISLKTAEELVDESTAEIEASIAGIEKINIKVRANLDREKAEADAEEMKRDYEELTDKIESVRQAKKDLLDGAKLPLEGLSVENGELTYNGFKWDAMSSSEQLKVATAIVRKLNPDCGFVLVDKLEQMDAETMREFGIWLEKEGLQVIATRVSTGDECSVIIEDGMISRNVNGGTEDSTETGKQWKEGVF